MALKPIQMDVKLFLFPGDESRSRKAMQWLMLGLMQVNVGYIRSFAPPLLYDTDVLYRAEQNTERWGDIPTILSRGYGDCEDLACWRAAEYRVQGINALPYMTWRKVGNRTIYHALLSLPNGLIEDPSRALGMRGHPIVRRPVFVDG